MKFHCDDILIEFVSEDAVLIVWPEKIEVLQHQQILWLQQQLTQTLNTQLLDTVASFNSLYFVYCFQTIKVEKLVTIITQLIAKIPSNIAQQQGKHIEIPVYYNTDSGWDLHKVAQQTGLTIEQIIKVHVSKYYRAYARGFTPGFCYLATLDTRLVLPRMSKPRTKVPAGAVAIAQQQTAIYPDETPGGWHILGQTPVTMYKKTTQSLTTLINVGDTVTFKAINLETFLALGGHLKKEDITHED